jgi:hypothetical protein
MYVQSLGSSSKPELGGDMKTVLLSCLGSGFGLRSALWCSLLLAVATTTGCKKEEEPPPPLPEAKPAATPETLELEIPEEDAGEEEEPKKTGTGKARPRGLAACCAALRQNAASAPPESKGHMLNAAAACDAANAAGAGTVAGLAGLLRGAKMPSACQ